jgi:DNA-binding response OmpR family regulator
MNNYTILIVDDEIEIIQTIIELLEKDNPNYNFLQSTSGETSLKIAEKHKPDLIITDWQMPVMTGIDLIRKLKNNPSTIEIPVIMLTGKMTSSEDLKTALEAGAIDFIRKPIDAVELSARMQSMLLLSDYYKEIVNLKNREIMTIAMNIIRNNEFNLKVLDQINTLKSNYSNRSKQLSSDLKELSHEISIKIRDESWMQFEAYFKNVNPQFFKHLTSNYPDLTSAELKLAAFLRLNLSTKEIASIIFLSPDSIKTARSRLRKKLNLSPEENINAFLMSV